ncbi:hypothetical protein [Ruminobacter amylophilus]|uniref:hypothetical protein n=1 Tax=Ruminobacter amylophilus TaxID=867 RepID=UPI0038675B51
MRGGAACLLRWLFHSVCQRTAARSDLRRWGLLYRSQIAGDYVFIHNVGDYIQFIFTIKVNADFHALVAVNPKIFSVGGFGLFGDGEKIFCWHIIEAAKVKKHRQILG